MRDSAKESQVVLAEDVKILLLEMKLDESSMLKKVWLVVCKSVGEGK